MLLDAPGQWDRYGSVGSQFGVKNMEHRPNGGAPTNPVWVARSSSNPEKNPGFMLGATGVFGTVNGKDASEFDADGSVKAPPQQETDYTATPQTQQTHDELVAFCDANPELKLDFCGFV